MICPKCNGLMVRDWFYSENEKCKGIRCINCGKTIFLTMYEGKNVNT